MYTIRIIRHPGSSFSLVLLECLMEELELPIALAISFNFPGLETKNAV